MRYKNITEQDVNFLIGICGENNVFFGEKINIDLSQKQLPKNLLMHKVIVEPKTNKAVSDIIKYACDNNIPINPRQLKTGAVGGIYIDMNNINKGIELDDEKLNLWFR